MGTTPNLLVILNQIGLQKDNPKLYQVLSQLIGNLGTAENSIAAANSSTSGGAVTGTGTPGSITEWLTSTSLTDVDQAGISAALDLLP